ncbi:hypothetical protein TNCV_3438041 [Trichonephila clavipes]|nr:hypothetical protein TNCV_3438041 [Trichonephila clavipes]
MAWRHTNSPVRVKAKRTISSTQGYGNRLWDRHGVLSFGWGTDLPPPYSQTWLRGDFLIPLPKRVSRRQTLRPTADEVKEEVQDWLSSQAADVYDLGIQKLS